MSVLDGNGLAIVLIRMRALHHAAWRPIFEVFEAQRAACSLKSVRLFYGADDMTDIVMWCETTDIAKARALATGREIRSGMQAAGVIACLFIEIA